MGGSSRCSSAVKHCLGGSKGAHLVCTMCVFSGTAGLSVYAHSSSAHSMVHNCAFIGSSAVALQQAAVLYLGGSFCVLSG